MRINRIRSITVLMTAALLCTAMSLPAWGSNVAADETSEQAEAEAQAPKVLTSADGVITITAPADGDNWTVIEDDAEHFIIEDGKDVISVRHIPNGSEELTSPPVTTDQSAFAEMTVITHSTPDEIFIVLGLPVIPEEKDAVREAVMSFRILQYGTMKAVTEKPETPAPVYTIQALDEIRYCTEKDGVNVRSDHSIGDNVIGAFHFEDKVHVTGKVVKDGADTAWIRVDYNGLAGYTNGAYYSTTVPDSAEPQTQPEPESPAVEIEDLINSGQIFSGAEQELVDPDTGEYVFVRELNQGGWINEATGVIYTQESGGGSHYYGDDGSVLVDERVWTSSFIDDSSYIDDGTGEDGAGIVGDTTFDVSAE